MPGFPVSLPVRLAQNGMFLRDAVSGCPLGVGPGSIGIVLRAQGVSGSSVLLGNDGSYKYLPGLSGPGAADGVVCSLAPGYHYDVEVQLQLTGSEAAGFQIHALLQYSEDDGATWLPVLGRLLVDPHVKVPGTYICREIDWDRTAAVAVVTRMRLLAGSAHPKDCSAVPGLCAFRIEQYVIPAVSP